MGQPLYGGGRADPRRTSETQTKEENMTNCWTYSAGERPNTVVGYEQELGGLLDARAGDPTARNGSGNWRRASLKHRDKTRAKKYAREQSMLLENGDAEIAQGRVTLARVFSLYEQQRSRRK